MLDFVKASELTPGVVVRTGDIAAIAEHDLVPPCKTMIVHHAGPSPITGYWYVTQADGAPLRVTDDRLIPIERGDGTEGEPR
jgi:hypothetical protein